MKKCFIFNVFDSVSENWLGNFFANTENHAVTIFKQFVEKNPSLNWKDLKLYCIGEFDSPFTVEACDKFKFVDVREEFEQLELIKDEK